MESVNLFGVRIDRVDLGQAVEYALTERQEPCWVVTPNAVMLDSCRRDPALAALLGSASLSLADGVGVMWAARRCGTPLDARVPGIAFGEALLEDAARRGLRVYLLGGGADVARMAADRLTERFADLRICGTCWGYFERGGEEERGVIENIRAVKPDILLVCMGFPLQERWIASHLSELYGVRTVVGLGGSLDVWSGQVRRAPAWLSHMGMEWAWRISRQPGRLRHLPALVRVAGLRSHDRLDGKQKKRSGRDA